MACALSRHHFYNQAFHHHRHPFPSYRHRYCYLLQKPLKRNPNFPARLCAVPESRDPKLSIRGDNHDDEVPKFTSDKPSSPDSFSFSLPRLSEMFKVDELGLEILSIALPAALALAAEPIASLLNTAFVGRLGSVELAAVGVSVTVFNLVSKLFNVPLLNVTTSFVAEEQALFTEKGNDSSPVGQDADGDGGQRKELLPSVSTSLSLAAGIGIVEAVALFLGTGFLMNTLGIPVDSPMRIPAEKFISMRAVGAPPIVIALAAQGIFRIGNLVNAILDAILMFPLGLGINGAAIATVISEYLIAFILLWKLNENFSFTTPNIDGRRLLQYLKAGGLLIARTVGVLVIMTLATSIPAKEGPVKMAGHQICLQIWLAISLLTDALALAGQALLAGAYSQGNYEQAQQIIYKVLQISLLIGIGLAIILFLGFGSFSSLFSTDPEVLKVAVSGLLFVAGSQPMNAIAFVLDGLYYGVSDFRYAAYSMVISSLLASLFMLAASPVFGLGGVWTGLFLFMTFRVVAGIWRLSTKTGPWKLIWPEIK
ncbi:hypothetical protein V2J09_018584 [Rumex salicifolius]